MTLDQSLRLDLIKSDNAASLSWFYGAIASCFYALSKEL